MLVKGLATRPEGNIVHVSTSNVLLYEVITIESLGCNVGGDTMFLIPNENDVVVAPVKMFDAVTENATLFPEHDGLEITDEL